MFSITVPKVRPRGQTGAQAGQTNKLGLTLDDYRGGPSTLCAGCGHDSITAAIVQASFELGIVAENVAKLSGIGCSSKTPAYFLSKAHGFNAIHGRMPPVATGAFLANRNMIYLAVSGDGDSGSIGLGHFIHAMRRRVGMVYIVENNGVYALTKGQFSATADFGALSKKGEANRYPAIDLVRLGIQLGASFVARSFSGDKKQLVPLLKAALSHKGFALLDVLSPCVSFNNHEESTKSYHYIREHEDEANAVDFVPKRQEISVDYGPGEVTEIELHDGSTLRLSKTAADFDPTDRKRTLTHLDHCDEQQRIATGLLYLEKEAEDLHDILGSDRRSLRDIPFSELDPGPKVLAEINSSLR